MRTNAVFGRRRRGINQRAPLQHMCESGRHHIGQPSTQTTKNNKETSMRGFCAGLHRNTERCVGLAASQQTLTYYTKRHSRLGHVVSPLALMLELQMTLWVASPSP